MSTVATVFDELARIDDPSVDRALAAALPTADADARRRIVPLLLERARHEGCVGLVLYRHLLEPDLQKEVDRHTVGLSRAVRLAVKQRQSQGPANAVRMIRASLAATQSYLVTEQLRAGDKALAELAAGCLVWLAQHAATRRTGALHAPIDPHAANQLITAVEDAVVHYPAHERREALTAMCHLLPRPMPRAEKSLGEAEHHAVHPMRSLLAEADHPAVRRALLWGLGVPTLVEPALAGLRRCCAEQTLGEAMELVHLLPLPTARKAMQRQQKAPSASGALWPDDRQVRQMSAQQQRALPYWAEAISHDVDELLARLTSLADVDHPATRLAALRRLLALSHSEPAERVDDCVARFVSDPDAEIARIAVWHVLRRKGKWQAQMLTKLVNSPHEQIRKLAAQRLAPIGFERLWEGWPQLSFAQRLACGRALVKIDPHFHRLLGERLASDHRDTRLRGLSMIGDLQQGSFFVTPLTQLARDDDAYIASAAVSALGSAEGEDAIGALKAALDHKDARVRANAVEALAKLEATDHVHELIRIATRDANRPRANAIGALMALSAGDAMTALHRMLGDTRPEHRASALWLVEQMGVLDVARDVAEMAVSDPDEPTRLRADRVVHELIDLMQSKPVSVAV